MGGARRAAIAVVIAALALGSFVRSVAARQSPTQTLLVTDIGRMSADEQLMFTALQGIANPTATILSAALWPSSVIF